METIPLPVLILFPLILSSHISAMQQWESSSVWLTCGQIIVGTELASQETFLDIKKRFNAPSFLFPTVCTLIENLAAAWWQCMMNEFAKIWSALSSSFDFPIDFFHPRVEYTYKMAPVVFRRAKTWLHISYKLWLFQAFGALWASVMHNSRM